MRCFLLRMFFCLSVASGLATPAAAQDSAGQLSALHDALRLSADQEGAWRDYESAIAANPQARARRSATQRLLPALNTPRRLALLDAAMAEDLADFRRQGEAVRAFYARLAPDQQAIFDRQTAAEAPDRSR